MWTPLVHSRGKASKDTSSPSAEISKVELLSAMDIFKDLSQGEIAALIGNVPMTTAKKGAVIYRAGNGPEVLFMLKAGKVELYHRSPGGKKLTVAIVEQGTFFGEMSLVGQRLLGTDAVALEDSVLCAMSRHDVRLLMLEHPIVAFRVIEVLARRLEQTRNSLQEMAFSDVTGRVASLLLRLANQETGVIEGYSHQDLAAMVGCLRESFTETLDRFKQSRALTVGRKRIEIVDRSQLEWVVSQRSLDATATARNN